MNQKLQNILDIIQQSEKLDAEQKGKLLQAIEDADKELEITAFKLERTEKVKKTTAILLEETIEELEQKRKAVEEQNRELEIEASLERVRTAVLEMKKQDDLMDVAKALLTELIELGYTSIRNTQIEILNDEKQTYLNYLHSDYGVSGITESSYDSSPVHRKFIDDIKSSPDALYSMEIKGKELDKWREQRKKTSSLDDPMLEKISVLYFYSYSIGTGAVGVSTFEPIDNSKLEIIKKFRNVFFLSYQRFSDIVLAEKQTREAQIELALERVRARTMAMQKSEELKDVIKLVYDQFVHLKINVDHAGFVVDYTPKGDWHFWIADQQEIPSKITHPYFDSVWAHQFNEAKEKGMDFFATNLNFEEKNKFYNELLSYVPGLPEKSKDFYLNCPGLAVSTVLLDNVGLYIENFSGTPYTDAENNILMRFGKVFQQTYTRFLDLQKAEAQAREAQIEASLEKVRAVAMSMNRSEDLLSICEASFKEFKKLGFDEIRNALIHIQYDEQKYFMDYDFSDLTGGAITKIEYGSHPIVEDYLKQIRSAKDAFYQGVIKEDQLEEWKNFRRNSGQIEDPRLEKATALYYYFFSIGMGDIGISTLQPIDEFQIKILKRFRNVFDLAYRRYYDITIAEEQAKETQIQLALERVRARTMAMHKSDELSETSFVLFEQLKELGEVADQISIMIYNEKEKVIELYATIYGNQWNETGRLPLEESSVHKKIFTAWQERKKSIVIDLSGKDLDEFNNFKMKYSNQYNSESELPKKRWVVHNAFFSKGVLTFSTHEPRPAETIHLLERFAGVFDLTYTRFLDLQKAEAQAREAEIEAALERVRSRTMAMQKSDELADTASHLFEQLNSLGIKSYRFNIAIVDTESEKCRLWSTTNEGKVIPTGPLVPLKEHNVFNQMYEGWKQQQNVKVIRLQGEERIAWTKYIMNFVSFNEYKPENIDLDRLRNEPAIFSNFFFKQGFIVVHTIEEINDADIKTIQRFVNVFEQTYTRFLDLQKAEAQAREAQIEAALERVRSNAMAMHNSNDISSTASTVFTELKKLGINPIRSGVGIISKDENIAQIYSATSSGYEQLSLLGTVTFSGHQVFKEQYEHWLKKKDYFAVLKGKELTSYYRQLSDGLNKELKTNFENDEEEFGHWLMFSEGFLYAWSYKKYSEAELNILDRFKKVIELTFKRYFDLKNAEAQAKEAIKQAALDRIRGEIASMRTSEDLNHITPIIWRELKNLEVPFFRCGVYIVDEKTQTIQVYLTTPDGESLGVLNLSFDSNKITSNTVDHWRKKIVYKTHWDKEEFISWTESMMKLGQIKSAETYQGSTTPPESLYLHFVPFAQGMLYVGDVQPLTDEKLQLVKTLAEAFSIAYARYEDFKNLEEAKNKIELTLNELKAAQAQLIHSEKMASLGELTAGIAHEIKNPLNFVNNFSEVSRELLDEMKIEIENKNINEVIELIEDLKQNLEKINQHGKRADSIVKGMLLHSRGTSGEKTPTDINDLLDQYINLAYHGMRAQNKEFNITIEKDYDETLEKLNVVPQDISRVFLNIINNACYAAFDKKKKSGNNFSPTLKVSTKKVNNKVQIQIGDNGNGIRADHLEKIFQPFFTTKPSGEGTGLGLSLSYDIVTKVHGGEMKVETKVGEGTEFLILLPSQ